jgi:PAS domain-containing protein
MVLSAIVDISARKRLEERFRLVVESAPNAIVMIGPNGLIEMVNAQTERVFGYRAMSCSANQSKYLCLSAIAPTIRGCGSRSSQLRYQGQWEQDATSTA